jgi:hypothetical protein
VHKPGIVALRPLGLGDIYDGAFQAIRQNPKTVIGLSVVLVTGALVLPTLASVVLAATGDLVAPTAADPGSGGDTAGLLTALALNYLGQLLVGLAGLLLTGLIVHVVAQAVLGRRTSAGEAWRAVRGRMLRLVGLTLLAGLAALLPFVVAAAVIVPLALYTAALPTILAGLVLVPLAIVASLFVEVRFFLLANPALVLERAGIGQAVRRAGVLSRGQFWRLFGIYLLTSLVVGIIGGVLGVPFTLLATVGSAALPPAAGGLVYVLGTYVGLILTRAITTPFTAAVVALQYVDQRIRKEAFDVELLSQAGQPPAGS